MKSKEQKILFVEDDIFLLSMYSSKFVAEGFVVKGAMNAKDGLTDAIEFKPDLIIMDIMLPDEDGLQLLKRLKETKGTANIPVAVLSNLSEPIYREQSLIYGALDYWIKTYFDPAEIVEKAKRLLV